MGAIHMLGLAKRVNVKILQASTSDVYGDPVVHPQAETYWGNVNPIGPINLGNTGEITILELAEEIIRMTGSSSKIVFNPLPKDDPMQRKPDISLATEKLKWTPAVKLEDGLKETISYFKAILD
jgi:nucleoside-diphosphate-sugar epimerase